MIGGATGAAAPRGMVSPNQEGAATTVGALPVRQILVVDDDPDINRLVRVRLTSRGFMVETAANGEEALGRIAAGQPDLIFLDISMPGIGGLEVLDDLRARGLDRHPIIMREGRNG